MAAPSVTLASGEKKRWWLTDKKMVVKYVREAKLLIATQEPNDFLAALMLLNSALVVSPQMEVALELKARCLLHLRRFKEVADMLQDFIASLKMWNSDDTSKSCGSSEDSLSSSRERDALLADSLERIEPAFKCISLSNLKRKVMAGLWKNVEKQGHWRYLVLGQACCQLGLMEDAMVLLQTGKRLDTAAFRRESICLADDIFKFPLSYENLTNQIPQKPVTESESISHLLCHIKHLIHRKTAAIAALDAGLCSEAVRHFSKIIDSRRGVPNGFLVECYVHRASAYQSMGRIAESIADCNRALALDTSCIDALTIRATLFETIRCLPDSLHDLEQLKLLYNAILQDGKLPGPVWKGQNVQCREIPGKLCLLASKIQQVKHRVAGGETGNVDYYAFIGLRRGCSRSELERAHLILTLRHKPDKSSSFVEKCTFADEMEMGLVRGRAKMSALMLYRLIQNGFTSLMATILDEAAAEKQRKKAAADLLAVMPSAARVESISMAISEAVTRNCANRIRNKRCIEPPTASVFQGVFCSDLAVVGNLLSQTGFNRTVAVKYEALSC